MKMIELHERNQRIFACEVKGKIKFYLTDWSDFLLKTSTLLYFMHAQ